MPGPSWSRSCPATEPEPPHRAALAPNPVGAARRRGRQARVPSVGLLDASWTVEIDAPRQQVFDVAADVPASPVWQPALMTVSTLETDERGRATLVDSSSDAKVKTTHQRLRFNYDDEPAGMNWVQEEGDTKSLEGSWTFEEIDGGERTRATFALLADPGRVLGMLLRGPVEGKVKEFLTKGAAEGLKEHVENNRGS